jgi:hypothetical protein
VAPAVLVLVGALALAGCGKDIQRDRSSLQEVYGTDHKHADCIANRLEDQYSDSQIEDIDQEVRDIENHKKTPEQASELFQQFDADLHAAATDCGVKTGDDETTTTAAGATGSTTAATSGATTAATAGATTGATTPTTANASATTQS